MKKSRQSRHGEREAVRGKAGQAGVCAETAGVGVCV